MSTKNKTKLNKEQRKLFLDMLIGDGMISHNRLEIKHSIKQENYVLWKQQLLKNVGIDTKIQRIVSQSFGKEQPCILMYSKTYSATKHMKNWLYRPNKFIYHPSFFNNLDDLSIAIWYMDDGFYSKYKNQTGSIHQGVICLSTFVDDETNNRICAFFKNKYDINFRLVNCRSKYSKNKDLKYIRTTNVKSTLKFLDIVQPYVEQVPCMVYKLHNNIFLRDIINNLNTKDDAVMLNPRAYV